MLTSWRLSRFKSVTDQTDLVIAPITLFTGANSAGKSTIIQSMLLTAQTIQSSVYSRPVVLNGHMARLGSFQDLVSLGDKTKNISIGFDLSVEQQAGFGIGSQRLWRQTFYVRRGGSLDKISADFSFSVQPGPNDSDDIELSNLQPGLIESKISVDFTVEGKKQTNQISIKRSSETISERIAELKLPSEAIDSTVRESLRYSVSRPPRRDQSGGVDGLPVRSEMVGAFMHHFLPRGVASCFDEVSAQVAWQVSMLTVPNFYRHYAEQDVLEIKMPPTVVEFINTRLEPLLRENDGNSELGMSSYGKRNLSNALRDFNNSMDFVTFVKIFQRLSSKDFSLASSPFASEKQTLENLLRAGRQPSYDLETQPVGNQISAGVDYIHYFFSRAVKYLGPLRDEPKPVYPLAGAAEPNDVGFRGEHTAAVLDIHKNTVIEYMPTEQFAGDAFENSPRQAQLAYAVRDWLSYMGVGEAFHTGDLGKLGHELKISTHGSELQHDLTQVGVGVSQVLPILVLALLADRGSTLIFEQPELHLHPKVQSRLADFFVSMSLLGKQCIIETHSEYLVTRLRFRAASDVGKGVAESIIMYFVEKEASKSVYRKVRIDELGGLDSWPAGFFDESEHATAALLRQGLKKRKAAK